ncbi:MAG: hypothetical protein WBF73_26540, partial [Bradyrhizobium sp.]
PSPKMSIDIDKTIAENRKRKPGSIGRRIRLCGVLRRPLSQRERGENGTGRVRGAFEGRALANQVDPRISQRIRCRLLKIGGVKAAPPPENSFL